MKRKITPDRGNHPALVFQGSTWCLRLGWCCI